MKSFISLASICFLFLGVRSQAQQNMSVTEVKAFIKEVFSNVIEAENPTEDTYRKYFSRDYLQYVDGKILTFDDFVAHMKKQKEVLRNMKVTVTRYVGEQNRVATVHLVDAEKRDGTKIKAQVNAIFEFQDGKIVLCDELTHLLVGAEEDNDLGSRK